MATYQFHIYAASVLGYDGALNAFVLSNAYSPETGRFLVTVTDDDLVLDSELDPTQTAVITDAEGAIVAEGLLTSSVYGICESYETGGEVYFDRIEIDGIRYGYSASEPLTPGGVYPFIDADFWSGPYEYYESVSVPCLAPGTRVETATGRRPVEALRPGDLVATLDRGLQPLAWTGACAATGGGPPPLSGWPVRLPGGWGRPLVVSAQHRVLLRDPWFDLVHDSPEVLAPSCGLAKPRCPPPDRPALVWHHLLFARHEVILAEGVWTESLFAGGAVFEALPPAARLGALAALGRADVAGHTAPARPCLTRGETMTYRALQKRRCGERIADGARTGSHGPTVAV